MTAEQKTLRPFHETIVDCIQHATSSQLVTIRTLLKTTVIPQNWDKIIEVWKERIKGMNFDDEGVVEHLEAQKAHAAFLAQLMAGGR